MYILTASLSIRHPQGGLYSIQLLLVLANVIFTTTLIPGLMLMLKEFPPPLE